MRQIRLLTKMRINDILYAKGCVIPVTPALAWFARNWIQDGMAEWLLSEKAVIEAPERRDMGIKSCR